MQNYNFKDLFDCNQVAIPHKLRNRKDNVKRLKFIKNELERNTSP